LLIPPPVQRKETETAVQKEKTETPQKPLVEKDEVKPIPKTAKFQPVSKGNEIRHKVVAGETFYSLSRMYRVSVDAIKNANPSVDVLKTDETVIVPSVSGVTEAKTTMTPTKQNRLPAPIGKKTLKVAILLPFSLDGDKNDPTIEKFVDFYRGVLIALADIKKEKSVAIDVYTYDIAKTVSGVSNVLAKEELAHSDLIIGPAYAAQIKPMAAYAKEHKIYTVIPFTQKVEGIAANPYLLQFNPSSGTQSVKAAALFAKQFRNHNIIIAKPADIGETDEGELFAGHLAAKLNQQHIAFTKVTLQDGHIASIKPLLNESKPSVVVLATANAEKAAPYLSAFAQLNTDNKHIPLYGFLDWEPETNVYPNLYYSSLFYTHDKETLSDFNSQYAHWFHLKPNSGELIRYDLLGYDLAFYFISLMNSYGIPGFTQHLTTELPENIESRFAFKKVAQGGGYQNNELHLLNYKSGKGVTLVGE
jgi:hypothetical protein